MNIEVAQTNVVLGRKEENLENALGIIRSSKADFVVFPELFSTGMDLPRMREHAESLDGETVKRIREAAGEKKLVAAGIAEKDGENIYNTLVVVGSPGCLSRYRKVHLFGKEKECFTPGNDLVVMDTVEGRIGLTLCYDLRFPEMYRKLSEHKADAVIVCANFPAQRQKHWDVLLKARAIENQFYVIGCNRVGADRENNYAGGSVAIDPWGEVVSEAGNRDGVLWCRMDKKKVDEVRRGFPVLGDRRIK